MNLQRIEELWARLVADEALEPAEEQELAAALSADAALRMRLLQDEQLDGRLRFRFQQNEASTEKFVHAVGTRIKAEGDASRFTAKVTDQVRTWAGAKQPRVEPGWRWRGAAVGAAAVLLFGVALWQLWPRKQPPPIVDRTPERVGPIVDRHSEAIEPDKIAPRLPEPLYVADVGDNAARGSKDTPLRDIGHAVSRAQ
ncbi:MAG TPA: hypothetical protein VEJ63_05460, partial [Planctomycetota bacterium]|nr:hypothetical protein [Planctomycetota bacterium]